MTTTQKIIMGIMGSGLIIFIIITLSLNSKIRTYDSAMKNTSDANVFEIDNLKSQIQARENANDKDRQTIRNKYCAELIKRNAMLSRFVDDGTCEVE